MNIWVIFNSFGEQVYHTYTEKYANLDSLDKNIFDISNCSVELNIPNFNPYKEYAYCVKNIKTNEITVIKDRNIRKQPITLINQDTSSNIVDTSSNIVDLSINVLDISNN